MNRNFVLNGEAVDPAIRTLFSEVSMQLSNNLYYKEHGYTDYDAEIPDEKFSTVSGFGKGTLTVAGKQYGSNTRYKGYASTQVLRKYTSEIDFTEEDIHWLQKAPSVKRAIEFRSNIEGAVNALNANINEDAAKMFYLAHGTTFFTGGDALPLGDQAHLIRKSGVTAHPNLFYATGGFGDSSTHLAFSGNALIEILQRMDRYVLNDGTQLNKVRRLRILCATELAETVNKTLYSMYGPNTANLGKNTGAADFQNAYLGRTIDVRIIPDQTTTYKNYWAVIDMDRASKMLFMGWGWRPRINNQSEVRKGLFYNEGSTLFGPHAADWRFSFFTKGDGTTVS